MSAEQASSEHVGPIVSPLLRERWELLIIAAAVSIVLTLLTSGITFFLPYQTFSLPLLCAALGWIVLLIGVAPFCHGRRWAYVCELLGCALQWGYYGYIVALIARNPSAPMVLIDFNVFENLLEVPIIPLTLATALLIPLNLLAWRSGHRERGRGFPVEDR